jgi:hypothetical protein
VPVSNELVASFVSLFNSFKRDLGFVSDLLSLVRDVNVYRLGLGGKGVDVVASDSSRVVKKFRVAVVFGVQVSGVRFGARRGVVDDAEAGYCIIPPASGSAPVDSVMRRVAMFLSRELEVSAVQRLANGGEVALFDGSLFSFLWYAKHPEIPENMVFAKRVKPSMVRDLWRSTASRIADVAKKARAIFIAKTIRRSYYVEKLIPEYSTSNAINDLLILDLLRRRGSLPKEPHFIEPVHIEKVSDLPLPLARLDPEDEQYIEKLLPITVTYVAFSSRTPPYQVTAPGKLSIDELDEVLSTLTPYSLSGYPDPLRVAHVRCKLSWQEVSVILAKVGFVLSSGRELLGEFI